MNTMKLFIIVLVASLVLSYPQNVENHKKRNIHQQYSDDDGNNDNNYPQYQINPPVYYNELTCSQYADAYNAIDDFITNPSFSSFAIQALVRLSFHDCVGTSCDGCLNPLDTLNAGLSFRSTTLDILYDESFHNILSRADFYALAGHVALIRGVYNTRCSENCPSLWLDYQWGRKDCSTSPFTNSIDGFPNAHGDFSEVWRVLNGMFGLDLVGAVALMGGHSLGGAHTQFSGFNFSWQFNDVVFDNAYFQNMLANGFIHANVGNYSIPSQRWEFVRPITSSEFLMMLNVDMSLWREVTAITYNGQFTGHLSCAVQNGETDVLEGAYNFISECGNAITAATVINYANDLQSFYNDFSEAWSQMVYHGYGQNELQSVGQNGQVCGSCVPPGAFCVPGYSLSGACCEGYTCEGYACQLIQ